MVSVANWMEVLFTFSVNLRWTVTGTWEGSDASCKILTFLSALGPNMAAMALGALAVHVLLTTITGCQGNRLRHALVIGLFVLLSLPLPVSKVSSPTRGIFFFLLLVRSFWTSTHVARTNYVVFFRASGLPNSFSCRGVSSGQAVRLLEKSCLWEFL